MAFCSKCGFELVKDVKFCSSCGNGVGAENRNSGGVPVTLDLSQISNKIKMMNKRHIIKVCASLLVIFFFTLPLVQCSYARNLTATGMEIATGTGNLFAEAMMYGHSRPADGHPIAFLLLIIPAALLLLAFTKIPFLVLVGVSMTGIVTKVIFIIVANQHLREGIELTPNSWLVLLIYIGLFAFTCYCSKDGIRKSRENIALIVALAFGIAGLVPYISLIRVIGQGGGLVLVGVVVSVVAVIFNFIALKSGARKIKIVAGVLYLGVNVFAAVLCFIYARKKKSVEAVTGGHVVGKQ